MSQTTPAFHTARRALTAATLACAGLALAGSPVLSQPMEEITVTAPRTIHEQVDRSSMTGAPIERITLTRQVSYADLDLSKTVDANMLKARIADKAIEACKQLDSLYPLLPKDSDCVTKATDGAMEQADAAIAAAGK